MSPQRGGQLRRGSNGGWNRLPQHLADDGSWCPGSGEPPKAGGWCPADGCTARRGSLAKGSKRTDPGAVAEAAVACAVRRTLDGGLLLPVCAVPLDPEPDAVTAEHEGPFITVVVIGRADGTEDRVWVSVEAEDRRTRRHGTDDEENPR